MEKIFVDVYDEGQWGVRLEYEGKEPLNCPGLGGWKEGAGAEMFFTRVLGSDAESLLRGFGDKGYGELTIEKNRIVGMESYK